MPSFSCHARSRRKPNLDANDGIDWDSRRIRAWPVEWGHDQNVIALDVPGHATDNREFAVLVSPADRYTVARVQGEHDDRAWRKDPRAPPEV